eukprot:TRINITY_DN31353_c0_g1_i1.p1 TRINITY_DN31353_c0_g1~~TRINITY_DN31353_c0_g1_i1.p1  ORF type:complete len:631 (-),score=108.70 TRINITY_DN31353_c0_g1_i1:78-1970(-)
MPLANRSYALPHLREESHSMRDEAPDLFQSPDLAKLHMDLTDIKQKVGSLAVAQAQIHADVRSLLAGNGGHSHTAYISTPKLNHYNTHSQTSHRLICATQDLPAESADALLERATHHRKHTNADMLVREPSRKNHSYSGINSSEGENFNFEDNNDVDAELDPEMANDNAQGEGMATRNSFGGALQTAEDDIVMLQAMFEVAEISGREQKRKWWQSSGLSYEMRIDTVMGAIILLNAIFIGISMDLSDGSTPWLLADMCFSFIFLVEIGLKISLHGVCGQFCGGSRISNCFDASLIAIDLFQLILESFFPDAAASMKQAPSASLFRVVRLGKLIRIIRLLKHPIFQDLLAMMQGMIGGLSTLVWAMVLFFITVYVTALLFREFFGREDTEHVYDLFHSVPRSMFTTFRCSFGDCSDPYGVPIFEYVVKHYGGFHGVFYCIFVFTVSIGLFNVISAIFVESTMAAASALQSAKKKARLRDEKLWCSRVSKVVERLLDIASGHSVTGPLSQNVEDIYELDVPAVVIDEMIKDPEVIEALVALDIDPQDRDYLSDILDPDNGGTINVIELVEGLRRLRGEPRRSDIVTVNLILRHMQLSLNTIIEAVQKPAAAQPAGGRSTAVAKLGSDGTGAG